MGEQLSFTGQTPGDIRLGLEAYGHTSVRHGLSADKVDAAITAYANFTDTLPDPPLEVMEAMIPVKDTVEELEKSLDDLDRTQNKTKQWNKYFTNYPEFAKPGGYTNRSLQAKALRVVRGIDIADDPKEFYHFHPNSTVRMRRIHKEHSLPPLPSEVDDLHATLMVIHTAGAEVMRQAYYAIECTHPELVPKHFGPRDVQSSPLRLLFYHPGQGDVLAAGHYDKASFTAQMAESHKGLWIGSPETGLMDRDPEVAEVFSGKAFRNENCYPDSVIEPGWHGVVNLSDIQRERQLHGKNVARWAIIFFANSLVAGTILDKSLTHSETAAHLSADELVA
ncbi:MAG: hypothetical protein JWS12_467 [Candidatus Saccharibacteria bacterium]|nr:hypothetical protein [Candidatus Saccharibacteria bacterium]